MKFLKLEDEPTSNKVQIVIQGKIGTGKSTIAELIENNLRQIFDNIKITNEDEEIGSNVSLGDKVRALENYKNKIEIVIKTVDVRDAIGGYSGKYRVIEGRTSGQTIAKKDLDEDELGKIKQILNMS